jgi:DNA-binding response OmpR family regulator
VLVVDDDRGLQETLEALLAFEGYRPIIARDGIEALDELDTALPDLILLDMVMPRLDGFGFAAELERRGLRAAIPIIVLTADGRAEEKAARVGADDFVTKPFDLDLLLQKIARMLERR